METHARYILIGLFVIVASLAGSVCLLACMRRRARRPHDLSRAFREYGLRLATGAAVSFNGIRVGEVTNLQLKP